MSELSPSQIVRNVNGLYEGDLAHYFRLVMKAPNANAPYHNVRHMLHVFWEAYDGGVHMGLGPRPLRNLLIAGLMHDYGHTGRRVDDQVNIDIAVRGLDVHALDEDRPFLLDIRGSIRATKYPYGDEEFTQEQLILRDADQSQTFSEVWLHSVLYGLGQEMEMTYEQMLRMQRPFLEKMSFRTPWGRNKFAPKVAPRLALIDELTSILQ
jgi:hypothetical protein